MLNSAAERVVVVGSGVAGLATALRLSPLPVLLVTEGALGTRGSSAWAQGGIAAAIGPDDSPDLHASDTVAAGAGLCDASIAHLVAAEAADGIDLLKQWGVPFDRNASGAVALTLEAAHSRRRILHAGGDGTGAALVRALSEQVCASPTIEVAEHASVVDLLVDAERVVGVLLRRGGRIVPLTARAVVLATGGIGGLYASTTNPTGNWGSGLALAARAGAALRDLEFVQFHPTAIAIAAPAGPAAPLPLASEAVRGEGAVLVDDLDMPVMSGIPGGDLAPRDRVARAIWERLQEGRRVFLDAREALGTRFPQRFPVIARLCQAAGIDPVKQPIPVRPAAHYHMGGISTDRSGRTTLPGLWAVGEVASTGLHGANRLASNSLIEAVVFGGRAAEDIRHTAGARNVPPGCHEHSRPPADTRASEANQATQTEARRLMDAGVGVTRDRDGLQATIARLRALRASHAREEALGQRIEVALMIATAALARRESRGAHARRDFPETDPLWARHQATRPGPMSDAQASATAKHPGDQPA